MRIIEAVGLARITGHRARIATRMPLAIAWLSMGIGLIACDRSTREPTAEPVLSTVSATAGANVGSDDEMAVAPTETLSAACAAWPTQHSLSSRPHVPVSWISSTNRMEPPFATDRILVTIRPADYDMIEPVLERFKPASLDEASQIVGCMPGLAGQTGRFTPSVATTMPTFAVAVTDVTGALTAVYQHLCEELPGCGEDNPPVESDDYRLPYIMVEPDWTMGLRTVVIEDPLNGAAPIKPNGVDLSTQEAQERFVEQWTLQEATTPANSKGLRLMNGGIANPARLTGGFDGTGSRIVLFDTSPFSTGNKAITWAPSRDDLGAAGGTSTFNLDVEAPYGFGHQSGDKYGNHGLFVASMAYAVAPDASFRLIEVLEDDGEGTYGNLLDAVAAYLVDHGDFSTSLPHSKTVLNMSLGYPAEDPLAIADPIRAQLLAALATYTPTSQDAKDLADLLNGGTATLDKYLAEARKMGAVVVAAAGNDSGFASTWNGSDGTQYPARFTSTVAVAASNGVAASGTGVEKRRSCFSNQGQLLAPGGGLVGDANTGNCPADTMTAIIACQSHGNCPEALVGLVDPDLAELENSDNGSPWATDSFTNGHAYWEGSSFSAGLVSGLAALAFERKGGGTAAEIEQRLVCAVSGNKAALPVKNASSGAVTPVGMINFNLWTLNACN